MNLSAFPVNEAFPTALPPLPLSSPGRKDLELPINMLAERAAFQVGTNQAGRVVPAVAAGGVADGRSVDSGKRLELRISFPSESHGIGAFAR